MGVSAVADSQCAVGRSAGKCCMEQHMKVEVDALYWPAADSTVGRPRLKENLLTKY